MTEFMHLRSASSGGVFVGTAQNDVVLWDNTQKMWFVGPLSGGPITSDDVVNVSEVPGVDVSAALDILQRVPAFPPPNDNGNLTGAAAISVASNLYQQITLTGNTTLTINDFVAGRSQWGQLRVIQGAGGSHTLTIVGAKTPGSAGITLSITAGARDLLSLSWDGTELDVAVGGLAFG